MNVVIGQLSHRLHHDGKLLHARYILDHIQFGSSNGDVSEEVQEQIITSPYSVDVADGRVFRAGISRDHDVAFSFGVSEFSSDVTLNDFMRKVLTHRLATDAVDLKALLQRKTASCEPDVHETSAREVSISENWEH